MVKKFAIVINNVVDNVVVWDEESNWGNPPGSDLVDVTDMFVGPGFIRNADGTFSAPPGDAE